MVIPCCLVALGCLAHPLGLRNDSSIRGIEVTVTLHAVGELLQGKQQVELSWAASFPCLCFLFIFDLQLM